MDITRPLVSIVIPCYNVDQFVEEGVESALNQTYSNIEIICVDDGSTDNTLQILRQLESENPEVSVLTGPNSGASAARNRGLQQADGKWIQFLDADDLVDPYKIEHQVGLVRSKKSQVDLVAAGYVKRTDDNTKKIEVEDENPWISLIKSRLGITSSNLWRRTSVQLAGGWDESQSSSQETELMYRMLRQNATVVYDGELLTLVRRREGSISTSGIEKNWERYIELRKQIVQTLSSKNELTKDIKNAYHEMILVAARSLYNTNKKKSIKYVRKLLPNKFQSRRYSWIYNFNYKVFGFEFAEKIRRII